MRKAFLLWIASGFDLAQPFGVWKPLVSTLQKTNISPLYYVGSSIISSSSCGDPAQSILNRAVLLYDRLASLESSSTLNRYLSDQLTTMIVSMARHLRENDGTVGPNINNKNNNNNQMSYEQLELLTAILDTMERQIVEQQQNFRDSEAEGWRALYRAAQLIERAIIENVPYTQVRALVESYANVKAALEQQQLEKKAAEEASFAELWQKVAPFVPSTVSPSIMSSTVSQDPTTQALSSTTTSTPQPKVGDTEVIAKQLEDFLLQDENNNSEIIQSNVETINPRDSKPSPTPVGRRGAIPSPSPTPIDSAKINPSIPEENSRAETTTSGAKTLNIPGFSDPSVQERNQLARQLEEALLSDVETSDPVQAFLESLKVPATPPFPPQSPVTPKAMPKSPSIPTSSLPFGSLATQRQRDMAQRLEDALLAESDDDATDPVESFLASLQNNVTNLQKTDQSVSLSPSEQSFEDRVESFVQNLRQIRNVNSSDLVAQSPESPMITKEGKYFSDTVVRKDLDSSPSQISTIVSSERSMGEQSERPRGSTTSSASPFYFANSTFYFANMTYGDAPESETPEVTEIEKQELKEMENSMLVYLEATRPAMERSMQFAKYFAASASPIVQKGITSLGSAWIGLYSAAKTVTGQKWTETENNPFKESNILRLGPVQSVLDNIFLSIERGQIAFPFLRGNTVDMISSEFEQDIAPKDDESEMMVLPDLISDPDTHDGTDNPELNSADWESKQTEIRSTYQSELSNDRSSWIGSRPSGPSMEELARIWVERNRDTKDNGDFGPTALPSPWGEVSSTPAGDQILDESEKAVAEGLGLQKNEWIDGVKEYGDDLYESMQSNDRDRIEVLKRKLGCSAKDEPERALNSDPKMLEEALADIRIKLASRGTTTDTPDVTRSRKIAPSQLSSTLQVGVEGSKVWPNHSTSGSGFPSEDEVVKIPASDETKRSFKSLSNDLSSHWVDLASDWKERKHDSPEKSPSSSSFDADLVPSDDCGYNVANRNNFEELAKEWRERNRGE